MNLGAFSISLAVKDLVVSRDFYENFGFESIGGDVEKKYLIMKNGETLIGLFEGMFENNILTFNPGWDTMGQKLDHFTDIRDLQRELKKRGVQIDKEADETSSGPESFVVIDPDGNAILVDQHV